MIREAIAKLVEGTTLTEAEASDVAGEIMAGKATPAQIGAFLVALRMNVESVAEITGMARVMREHALRVDAGTDVVDIVGTGGDGMGAFNISTAAAFAAAAAGLRVAKHNNRAASGLVGSADLLEAKGIKIGLSPESVRCCIDEVGIGFMFAPAFHPATRHAAPVRRELGVRTIFNILGPLTNPAFPRYQVVGVAQPNVVMHKPQPELGELMAYVLMGLGSRRAWIVRSADGLDELTTTAPTHVWEAHGGQGAPVRDRPGGRRPCARVALHAATGERGAVRGDVRRRPLPRGIAAEGRNAAERRRRARSYGQGGGRARGRQPGARGGGQRRGERQGRAVGRAHEGVGMITGTILDRILEHKRVEVERHKRERSLSALEAMASEQPAPLDFSGALQGDKVRLIAEVKKASPSRGVMAEHYDPVGLAVQYADNGAAAISVLTEVDHFQGSLDHLRAVKEAVGPKGTPVLRKDFLYDPYQMAETRAFGADAALLIVAMLDRVQLDELTDAARSVRLQPLVEVHDEAELETALEAGAEIIGINHRDLKTFKVDTSLSVRLKPRIPQGKIVVAESGLHSAQDVAPLKAAGVNAILVGEALVTADGTPSKVRELSGV